MKQITEDWNRITGLVRRLNYLKISPNPQEEQIYLDALDTKLNEYMETYQKPYNPAVPE